MGIKAHLIVIAVGATVITGCSGKQRDHPETGHRPFAQAIDTCACQSDDGVVQTFNLTFADNCDPEGFYKLDKNNTIGFEGLFKKVGKVIYFKTSEGAARQMIFNFDAVAGEIWKVEAEQVDYSFTVLNSRYDKTLSDSTLFLKIDRQLKTNTPILPSHMSYLSYLNIGLKLGLIDCYFTAEHGLFSYRFYPNCKLDIMTFTESIRFDDSLMARPQQPK